MSKKVLLSGNMLTIIIGGNVYTNTNATAQDYHQALTIDDEDEIRRIMCPELYAEEQKVKKEKEYVESVKAGFESLLATDEFEVEGDAVYMKGIKRSLPELLIKKFVEVVNFANLNGDVENIGKLDEFVALKRFFMWCCCNPRAEVADKLYGFLEKNKMQITKEGMFVALRNVVKKENTNLELVSFISDNYTKIRLRRRATGVLHVWTDEEGKLSLRTTSTSDNDKETYHGNLKELYLNLPNMEENEFTDNWTKTMSIKLGTPVSMPKEDCNWSTQDCATAGLHFAGHTAPYVLCGDTTVFVLINPMKVVGIGPEKGRCYEYLPFMIADIKEADDIMNARGYDFMELDEEYAAQQLEGLEEAVKEGFSVEAKKHQFNLPQMSSQELTNIVLDLQGLRDVVKGRVTNFDAKYDSFSGEDDDEDWG